MNSAQAKTKERRALRPRSTAFPSRRHEPAGRVTVVFENRGRLLLGLLALVPLFPEPEIVHESVMPNDFGEALRYSLR